MAFGAFSSCKKYTLGSVIMMASFVGIYFMYFHRGSTQDILAANMRKTLHDPAFGLDDTDVADNDDPVVSSRMKWEKFIRENNYVSIGELYDKCDGDDRIMVGKTVMIPDPDLGGVKSRTFVNTTWDKLIDDGEMSIDVTYNGKDLYSNKWELCTIDDDKPDRIIFCPIAAGEKKYIKDLKIPNYIPKGRYVTKAHAKNQDGETLGCAFSEFVL